MPLPHNVLLISPTAILGGCEEVLFNLAACLPAYGVTPEVLSLSEGPLVERLRTIGVRVEVRDSGRLRDPVRMAATVWHIDRLLRSGRYSVVYSNMPKAHLYAAGPARRQSAPAVWYQAGFPAYWLDRLATVCPAAAIVAPSAATAAAQAAVRPRRPIEVINPGIDLHRFSVRRDPELRAEHSIPRNAVLVSLVGRLQPWKGQREVLLAAASIVRDHPEAYFAIVGGAILGWEGDYPNELERLAARLELGDRVVFTGHTNEVERWMAASDIVVNASHHEPFGLVIVEAMASGCAVVAVAAGGPTEIISDGESGLLVANQRPEDFERALRHLLRSAELRARLGAEAVKRAQHFSREEMTRKFAALLSRLAARNIG